MLMVMRNCGLKPTLINYIALVDVGATEKKDF